MRIILWTMACVTGAIGAASLLVALFFLVSMFGGNGGLLTCMFIFAVSAVIGGGLLGFAIELGEYLTEESKRAENSRPL